MSERILMQDRDIFERVGPWLTTLGFILALIFAAITTFQRLAIIQEDYNDDPVAIPVQRFPDDPNNAEATPELVDAAAILQRAEDTQDSVDLLLSFLEGASVILVVGLGAAAFFGFRQSNQLRQELEEELARVRAENMQVRKDFDGRRHDLEDLIDENRRFREQLEEYRPYFQQMSEIGQIRLELTEARSDLGKTINNVGKLIQADQEFRLRNYRVAYRFITEVLEDEPNNPLALYLAGWVEMQHIAGKTQDGVNHLERLLQLDSNWPSAIAAYGVALRRLSMEADGEGYDASMMTLAHSYLLKALSMDDDLVDFNTESFWGPLGGLMRDMGKIDDAIDYYRRALRVTPGSSYPQGNLASLLLFKAREDTTYEQEALNAFEHTIELATAELATKPNDHFLLMDLSMAHAVLGYVDPRNLQRAEAHLNQTLAMLPSDQHLSVSYRGWEKLIEYLPRRREWGTVREFITNAMARVSEVAPQ